MKNKGFTLSEVLIALLVLGIIVSASVPVIMKLAPNKNVAMIKKAYYTTETIVNSLINDPYYYPDHSYHCQDNTSSGNSNQNTGGTCYYGFDYKTKVYYNSSNETQDDATKKFRCLFASKLNIKEDLADVCDANTNLEEVTTMDGMTWNFQTISMDNDNSTLQIDVDGKENGVNAYSLKQNEGLCETENKWSTNVCNKKLTSRIKKNFDRIEIKIKQDGTIEITDSQEDFINIISGKKKIISGDDD